MSLAFSTDCLVLPLVFKNVKINILRAIAVPANWCAGEVWSVRLREGGGIAGGVKGDIWF